MLNRELKLRTYKKGARVMYQGEKAKVLLLNSGSFNSVKILLLESRERIWVTPYSLIFDQEFYREKKLNKLLK